MSSIELKYEQLNDMKKYNFNCFSFMYNNKKYFFKRCNLKEIHIELLMQEFAKLYGIDYVEYRLAELDGFYGLLSADSGYNTLDFFENGFSLNANNIENIMDFYSSYNYSDTKLFKLRNKLFDILIFDMLIGNSDRHSGNIFASLTNIGPIFDNANALCNELYLEGVYGLYLNDNYGMYEDQRIKFLSDDCYKDYVVLFIDKINLFINNFDDVVNEFKTKFKDFYIESILNGICRSLYSNLKNLLVLVNEYSNTNIKRVK